MDQPVGFDRRRKLKTHAKWTELNRNHGRSPRAAARVGNHGKRKLSAGQKTRFMPADRDEVRFSENLEKILALQQAQGRTEIEIRPEGKQVQQVGDTDGLVSQLWLTVRALRELQLADAWK